MATLRIFLDDLVLLVLLVLLDSSRSSAPLHPGALALPLTCTCSTALRENSASSLPRLAPPLGALALVAARAARRAARARLARAQVVLGDPLVVDLGARAVRVVDDRRRLGRDGLRAARPGRLGRRRRDDGREVRVVDEVGDAREGRAEEDVEEQAARAEEEASARESEGRGGKGTRRGSEREGLGDEDERKEEGTHSSRSNQEPLGSTTFTVES